MTTYSTLWLLLAILFSTASTNDGAIAYVRPSSISNVTCPDQPCLMLDDYAREKDHYFLNETSFIFLPGVHQLDLQLRLENISNVSLLTLLDDSVQILLSPMANITWIDCNNITITGLEVYLSGIEDKESLFSALAFQSTTSHLYRMGLFGNDSLQSTAIRTHSSAVDFRDVVVAGAISVYGAALIAFNSTIKFIGRNHFTNNTATLGGAMAVIESVVNFDGNVSFDNNTATTSNFFPPASGGAIYCDSSVLSFSNLVIFQHNKAVSPFIAQGGAIFARKNSVLTFEVSSSVVFTENSAKSSGGAIFITESEHTMRGTALFDSNFAGYNGGALSGRKNSRILCNSSKERIVFRNNYAQTGFGGAIYTLSTNLELEGILFDKNIAEYGGAIYSNDFVRIVNCNFHNNTAVLYGAVSTSGIAVLDGINNFLWNSAEVAIVSVRSASITFNGESNFLNNNVTTSSGTLLLLPGSNCFIHGNLTFSRNYALYGGGLHGIQSNVTIDGNSLFIENSAAFSGGGMMLSMCNLIITGQTSFFQNTADNDGSAVHINDSIANISGNMYISNNGFGKYSILKGSLNFRSSILHLTGNLFLENNTGNEGGAIYARDSELRFWGCFQCSNNVAHSSGGVLLARKSTISIRNNSSCNIFQTNVAVKRGGVLYSIDSTINLSGSQMFLNNSAMQGGAIAIDSSSKLVLSQPLQASFVINSALVGGAVFYEDVFSARQCADNRDEPNPDECFIELDSTSNIRLTFLNNSADSAGTVLYGGNLDHCRLYVGGEVTDSCGNRVGGNYSDTPIATINEISYSFTDDNVTSNISSDPLQICFCENGVPSCVKDNTMRIYTIRGKEFIFMALVVGQSGGVVPTSVRTSLDNDILIRATQRIQNTGKECTPITYHLSSKKTPSNLILFPDGPCRDVGISRREITIHFLPCPDGFTLEGSECVCEERLQRYTNSCNVDDNSIQRNSNAFWIGAVYNNATFGGLILHPSCPFDYCIDTPVAVKLDNLDIQCNFNHSGILCGSCAHSYSTSFGTLHCLSCSNVYLALIIPFALAGIALVAILLLFQISVASGNINGLIFYANVIQVNHSIFFPPGDTNILTVFIAWLNLDLGIETCFFDGMNIYIFTWLQFVFPLYVWFLIGLIIVLSRFSTKILRMFGKNPVAALATLFLLSYSKILRTIIVALSFTILEYPANDHQVVWLYDGNIPYFQSASHIVLGTVAIVVLLLLFLPYTLLLLCGHWLQAYSNRWIFSWLNKIMPLMDAYHAPYKKESRYWTGFLLLVRCALFLTFAFNTLGNASGSLLAIVSVTAGILILSWLRVSIYENIFNDFLEAAFLLNLCILAAGTYHVKEIGGNQAALAYTLVGIGFVLFVCIMLYHIYLRLHTTALWKKLRAQSCYIFSKLSPNKEKDTEANVINNKQENKVVQLPTVTTIELDACDPQQFT